MKRSIFMKRSIYGFICAFIMFVSSSATAGQAKRILDPENVLVMELKDGTVEIELFEHLAPNHVRRVKELTREGFYDGLFFHRVIEGFVVQVGDPTGTGSGGSTKPDLGQEFSDTPHKRGIVSMARASSPNSANSQFFIVLADAPMLDNQYTVFGNVISGMEFVDQIKKGDIALDGIVKSPDKIISMRLLSDIRGKR